MAHQIDMSNGRANIAYIGKTPWHALGDVMVEGASLDEWRRVAGMDWTAIEKPVYYETAEQQFKQFECKKALVRSDTLAPLSIVGEDYKVVQPATVIGFYADLVKENGLKMETAGCLFNGRRVWALASMDDSFTLHGRDRTCPYVMMSTSYDGSFATQAAFTTVRVVCNNTLELAGLLIEKQEGNRFRVPHSTEFNPAMAKGKLGLNRAAWEAYKKLANELSRRLVSRDEAMEYFTMVAGKGKLIERNADNGKAEKFPEAGRTVTKLIEAFTSGPGSDMPSARSTAWGLLQAASNYADYSAPAPDSTTRLIGATFKGGRNKKVEALRLVQDLMLAA